MNTASLRTALIAAVIVAIGAFALFSIGSATAQQACIQPLAGNGTVNGTWDNTCLSENTPLGSNYYPTGTRYARFYTFTLSKATTVTVELKSSADTYMYLMQGASKTGAILHYNDDITPSENTNSRISQSLSTGKYTIEATTYEVETTGSFTLTMSSGSPTTATPTITPTSASSNTPTVTPTATATPVPRQAKPTVTPTPTATPTPTQPSVPADVLNRLTALETRTATQQGLIATMESKITALDSRIAALEANSSNSTPSSSSCRITRPASFRLPVAFHDFWDKRDNCLIANRDMKDVVEFPSFTSNGNHEHGYSFSSNHSHSGGNHTHSASVSDPYSHSLLKYDAFTATNPNGTPWEATLTVPVGGLYPSLILQEYNPQTREWAVIKAEYTVIPPELAPYLSKQIKGIGLEWTPVTGRKYSVTATLRRGFTESPFSLTYDLASESDSQGAQAQIAPSALTQSQTESMLRAIEDMRLEESENVSGN